MGQGGNSNEIKAYLTNLIEKIKGNRKLLIILFLILFLAPYILTPAMEKAKQLLKDNTKTLVISGEETQNVQTDVSEEEMLKELEKIIKKADKQKVKGILEELIED